MSERKDTAYCYFDESDKQIKILRYNKRKPKSPINLDARINDILSSDKSYRREVSPGMNYLERLGVLFDNLVTSKERSNYERTAVFFYKLGFKEGTENMHFPYLDKVPENTYKLLVRLLHILGIQFHYEIDKGLTMTQCEDSMIPECFISKWLNEVNDRLDVELRLL